MRACGARPSAGRQAQDAWPNGENREITRRVVFSEGRGLRARKKRGGRMPGYGMMIGGKRRPGGQENTCPGQAQAFLTGVRSPPLRRDGLSRVRWPSGGNPGWRAGGFLGGTHSVRPRCEAGRKPTYSIPTGWVNDEPVAGGRGQFGWRYADITGVRSPPLRGGRGRGEMAYRGRAGDNAEVVSSEGRGLRARVVGPYTSPGIP